MLFPPYASVLTFLAEREHAMTADVTAHLYAGRHTTSPQHAGRGTLAVLHRLAERGLVEYETVDPSPDGVLRWAITDLGRQALADEHLR